MLKRVDIYKTPESELDIETTAKFKPIKAIVFGLLVSVVLLMFIGIIEGFVAAFLFGFNLEDMKNITTTLSNSTTYLIADLLITSVILFYAGRVVRKYAPHKEMLFAVIVTILTAAIYIPLGISANSFSIYPVWYSILSTIIVFGAIILGARPRKVY